MTLSRRLARWLLLSVCPAWAWDIGFSMISSAVDDGLAQRAVLRARSTEGACKPDGLRSDGPMAVPTDRIRERLPEPRSPGLSAEIIDHSDGFRSLKDDWNALFDDAANGTQVFLSFAMCWNWYLAFNSEENRSRRSFKLRILAVRDNGRLVVVCPLAEDRWLGLNRLSWFGSPVPNMATYSWRTARSGTPTSNSPGTSCGSVPGPTY